jgi:predicted dehydrogenase
LHLVVEKPLAHDLASARRIADAAAGAGVAASVCLPFRYEAPVVAAKGLADAGALGRFAGCAITVLMDKPPSYWAGGYSGRATSDWRTTRAAAGGGVLIMNATHYVDWALYLSGARVEEVAAFWRGDEAVGDVEDALAAALRFDGGAVGTIVCASSARGGSSASGVTLWGDLGQLIVGDISRAFTLRHVAGRTAARWHELPQGGEDARVVYFERFADAVLDERPPEITLADGLAVQEVVEAAYASAASGAPVRIGETAVARA